MIVVKVSKRGRHIVNMADESNETIEDWEPIDPSQENQTGSIPDDPADTPETIEDWEPVSDALSR